MSHQYRYLAVFLLFLASCSAPEQTRAANSPASRQTVIQQPGLSPAQIGTPDPNRPIVEWIQMTDQRTGWAITAGTMRLIHTVDGVTWRDVTPEVEAVRSSSSFFLDGATGFVSGFDESAPSTSNGSLFATRDGGQTWAAYALPFAGGSLHFQNASTGWAISVPWSAGTATAALGYQTRDGGKSWSQMTLKDPQGNLPDGFPAGAVQLTQGATLTLHSAANLWLGGGSVTAPTQRLRLWGSWDGGQTWQAAQIPSPVESEGPTAQVTSGAPVFLNDQQAFFTATFVLTDEEGGNPRDVMAFYASSDGGKTWEMWPSLVNGTSASDHPSFVSDQAAFVRCGMAVCGTRDGGTSWQALQANVQFDPNQERNLTQVDFINEQVGWAVTPAGLFATEDGGKTWEMRDPQVAAR